MKLDLKYYISGNQLPVLVKDLSKQKLPLVTLSCPSITGRWPDSTLMHAWQIPPTAEPLFFLQRFSSSRGKPVDYPTPPPTMEILCMIFQASLDQGKIPTAWNHAYISDLWEGRPAQAIKL